MDKLVRWMQRCDVVLSNLERTLTNILASVEQIALRLAFFGLFLYGLYRFVVQH